MSENSVQGVAAERRAEYDAFCEWVRETPGKPFADMAWEAWQDGRARLRAALKAQPAPTEAQGEYSFSKPKGWINLANPRQSWEQWTKEQGLPTTRGWKIAVQGEDSARLDGACGCRKCNPAMVGQWFFVCQKCGNKRCPHATDHTLECTNSNEPGQIGSAYGPAAPQPQEQP